VTSYRPAGTSTSAVPRVGLFGLLGQGNLGNDASLEAVLSFLKAEHPDAIVDCLCSGPKEVTARYGIPAIRLRWYQPDPQGASGLPALARKGLGIGLGMVADVFRTASWVRRHDVVIVPGMGVLEATVPLRPWQTPYSMFLLCTSARALGAKVALISVGANVIHQRATRWLITRSAQLAHYRSYRDAVSRDAMRGMGLDTSGDAIYPDLVFSLPTPPGEPSAPGTVGVGVMDYSGGNDDRGRADQIRATYVETVKRFVLWLVENGRPVRLFTGDVHDERIVQEILAEVRAHWPEIDPPQLIAQPVASVDELMRQMASVDTVVATRYHNVICAVKMAKPTVSLGYAAKFDALMADMGLAGFSQPARSLDLGRLIEQFTEVERRAPQLRQTMKDRNAVNARLLAEQFASLSAILFPAPAPPRAHATMPRSD
jgi:polysaccharide pyruvyl transferase WcaK-like protein